MAITQGQVSISLSSKVSIGKSRTPLNATTDDQSYNTTLSMGSIGAGSGAFDQVYTDVRTLAGGASETLDLYGSLVNAFNETINFARIKSISVELLTTTLATSITVGNAASDPWTGPLGGTTPTVTIRNGGFFAVGCTDATGIGTVTNASADKLKILNNDGAVTATYRITIIGATT
jgi:hypothetical protein